MNATIETIPVPWKLAELYALTDRERFPCYNYSRFADARPDTLYYADFKVAEASGEDAIRDTFANCGNLDRLDYKMLTELILVLNHLLWSAFESNNEPLARLYDELWRTADAAVADRPTAEQSYTYSILD